MGRTCKPNKTTASQSHPVANETNSIQTLNIRGTFLVTQAFLNLLPSPTTPAKIVTLTTSAAYDVFFSLSAYGISKLAALELMAYVAAENPGVVAVAVHPGVVPTDMVIGSFKRFAGDTPGLVSGLGVWLAAWSGVDRRFLNGRFVSANCKLVMVLLFGWMSALTAG